MRLPDTSGLVLLLYLLVLLPWMAWRSAGRLREMRANPATSPQPALTGIYTSTLVMLALMFLLAWFTGRSFGYDPFFLGPVGPAELAAGAAALAVSFGLRWVSRKIRTEEERRNAPVYALMPRTGNEWRLYLAMALAAGIAEETAYRGVGWAVLTWSTGSAMLGAALLSVAFGLAHLTQEWKSVGIVIAMAALMHALVAITGTLVIAMVVHGVYDVAAGILGSREAERLGVRVG